MKVTGIKAYRSTIRLQGKVHLALEGSYQSICGKVAFDQTWTLANRRLGLCVGCVQGRDRLENPRLYR